jgi:hypothetical protein
MLLSKLLAILSTAKGAAAATVVVAAAVGTAVAATNADVQNAVSATVQNVTQSSEAKASNQPAVVASRNDADKKLRDVFQIDQQRLARLHSTHVDSTDRAKLDDTLNTAGALLRARLTKALDDVAALTLGREGLESPKPTGSPDIKPPFTAATQAKIDDIVKTAIADMDKIERNAEDAVALLPTAPAGKPADTGKPADAGKPATAPTPPAHPTP